jgi:hypothetical protein
VLLGKKNQFSNPPEKYKLDLIFMQDLIDKAESLSETPIFMYWFPKEIQHIIEPLLSGRAGELNVVGLLGLTKFAGVNIDDEDEFFKSEIIEKTFEPKKNQNDVFRDSQ